MYQPAAHEEKDAAVLHALIRSHPLGTWITTGEDGLVANHVPFLLDPDDGALGTLRAHCARANPVWREASSGAPSLVVFQGPEAYISPSWYPSKHQHGQAVPTWNYAVVHAHGVPRVRDDAVWLREHLRQLTATHESGQAVPWELDDAPEDYLRRMIGAVVGIEIRIDRLQGKWKVSQNRSVPDRLGVIAGLRGRGAPEAVAVAELVQHYLPE